MSDANPVLQERVGALAILTLNQPKALNALSLEMVQALGAALDELRECADVRVILLKGAGEKAFCAGGDVVSLHNAMKEAGQGQIPALAQQFFSEEYQVDYAIHNYPKPIVVWGSGIVMGGGLGLFAGASHRVVTPSTMIAMPEVTIGLFPDVGGSYFLNKMPAGYGLFLGLTGARIGAADALFLALADHAVEVEQLDALVQALAQSDYSQTDRAHDVVSQCCQQFSTTELKPAVLPQYEDSIKAMAQTDALPQVVQQLQAPANAEDKYWQRAQSTLSAGSSLSVALLFEQLKRGQSLTLAECFQMELVLACRCAEFGEFQEGVRALLVDKDQQPQWRYSDVSAVPDSVIQHFFTSPWGDAEHPLANLGGVSS